MEEEEESAILLLSLKGFSKNPENCTDKNVGSECDSLKSELLVCDSSSKRDSVHIRDYKSDSAEPIFLQEQSSSPSPRSSKHSSENNLFVVPNGEVPHENEKDNESKTLNSIKVDLRGTGMSEGTSYSQMRGKESNLHGKKVESNTDIIIQENEDKHKISNEIENDSEIPRRHKKSRSRTYTSYSLSTGWVAQCTRCGHEGKYRPTSEGRPFQHSDGNGKYCGYFRNNPRLITSDEESDRRRFRFNHKENNLMPGNDNITVHDKLIELNRVQEIQDHQIKAIQHLKSNFSFDNFHDMNSRSENDHRNNIGTSMPPPMTMGPSYYNHNQYQHLISANHYDFRRPYHGPPLPPPIANLHQLDKRYEETAYSPQPGLLNPLDHSIPTYYMIPPTSFMDYAYYRRSHLGAGLDPAPFTQPYYLPETSTSMRNPGANMNYFPDLNDMRSFYPNPSSIPFQYFGSPLNASSNQTCSPSGLSYNRSSDRSTDEAVSDSSL